MQTTPLVVPGLKAFMSGLIDYAGLYPPANLPLQEAITQYYHYLRSPDRWMLGHFVIGASRLANLTVILNEHPYLLDVEPLSLAVVGQGGTTEEDWLENLREDAAAIQTFTALHTPQVKVAQFEVKLPELPDAAAVTQLLQNARAVLNLLTFYEIPLDATWQDALQRTVAGIAQFGQGAGFKLRTGGLQADAFLIIEQVADILTACHEAHIPLKCTAGLHHAVRHFQADVQTHAHGFLNLFGGGILAQTDHLSPAQMHLILNDEHQDHFQFDERGFHWQVYTVKVEEIAAARQSALISFGSCSFDEPREDLRAFGWL